MSDQLGSSFPNGQQLLLRASWRRSSPNHTGRLLIQLGLQDDDRHNRFTFQTTFPFDNSLHLSIYDKPLGPVYER